MTAKASVLVVLGLALLISAIVPIALAENSAESAASTRQSVTLIPQLLPASDELPEGLGLHKPVAIYPSRRMLFDLIDGAAETHIRFGFQAALQAIYKWQGREDTVTLQIYQMDCDHNAYGLYQMQNYPESVDVDVGQEGNLQVSVILFWKDRFFVRLESTTDNKEILKKVIELGKTVAGRIPKVGEKPGVVEMLPVRGRIPKTIRFFHHQRIFQNIDYTPYLGKENVLRLGAGIDVATAKYRLPDKKEAAIFIISYPSSREAELALAGYRKLGHSEKAPPEVKAGKAEKVGSFIVGVWGRAMPPALKLLDEVLGKLARSGKGH